MTETLYSETHKVNLKCQDTEDKQVFIKITVEVQTTVSPLHRKDLLVRLTDDKDPFFLYNLCLGEEDFQSLKTQQGLLVDFSAFPQRFIALLQQCYSEEMRDTPKFLLQFDVDENTCGGFGGMSFGNGVLKVIETNPFKHLTHLCLNLVPGNDSDVKKYLATCLKISMERQRTLEEKLQQTEHDLKHKLEQTRQQLSDRSRDLDQLRIESGGRSERLTTQHTRELNLEREKALKIQEELQQRYDRERKESEAGYQKAIRQKEARLSDLENINKDLTDRRYRAEATIRELKTKLNALEEEHRRCRNDLQQARRENCSLDAERHAQDKSIQQLKTRVAVLEQELLDKEQLVSRITSSLDASQQQKDQLDERKTEQQGQIRKLEATVKEMSEELQKGNEIIRKLQDERRGYISKVKIKNEVTTRQEYLIGEKDQAIDKMKREIDEKSTTLKKSEEEVARLRDQVTVTLEKLEESKGLLKTNENVINWLNKQLNERQIMGRNAPPQQAHHPPPAPAQQLHSYDRHTPGAFSSYDRTTPHYSTPIGANPTPPHISVSQNTPIPISSSPGTQQLNQPHHVAKPNSSSPGARIPRPNVTHTPQVVYNPGKKDKENQSPLAKSSENSIDPKYLARSADVITVRSMSPGGAPSPPKTHISTKPTNVPSSRLSQQVINKATIARPNNVRFQPQSHPPPPIVSAYFTGALPKQA
uniref:Spindle assembly abnormal protein 6 homolog n=1 Tax=Phallusia mammillata TaxID=59560 RepID=A0A6F9DR06_9ASCI|nr:spindle assembly abnormal protein 6 homolog [Phallusia mammillata]